MPQKKTISQSDIGAISHETIHEQVYNKLSEALLDGFFAPGDSMKIRDLASIVGTSVMPVRDALRTLVAENALVLLPNRTIVVPQPTLKEVSELAMLRVSIEGILSEEAGSKISSQNVSKLERLNTAMENAVLENDVKSYLRRNREFHFEIYEAANMPFLANYVQLAWLRFGPIFNYLLESASADSEEGGSALSQELLCGNHEKAIEGAKLKDGVKIRKAIENDISECTEYIKTILESRKI